MKGEGIIRSKREILIGNSQTENNVGPGKYDTTANKSTPKPQNYIKYGSAAPL